MTNKTSNNWGKVKLGDIGKVLMCKRVFKGETSNIGEVPFYKIGTFGNKPDAFISQELYDNYRKKFSFPKVGDVLLSASGTIGKKVVYDGKPAYFQDSNIIWLDHDESKVLNSFLFFLYDTIEWQTEGSTIKRLYNSILLNKTIPLPSLKEQSKIVDILSSIDEAIQKTDQIIQKSETLKSGLMNELLIKGIGHKKFKKTKLGEIPEEWNVKSILDSDIEIIDGDRGVNYPNQQELLSDGHCLFLSNRNIHNDAFDFSEPVFISRDKDQQLRKGKLKRWDVVLTSRGSVGNVAIFNNTFTYEHIRINSGMLIFRAGESFDPEFLYYLLKSPFFKERYKQLGSGSAQPQLPIGSLRNLLIPMPNKKEQINIVSQLKLLDQKYIVEVTGLESLVTMKKGLMHDIFNQKVQIN